MEPVTSITQESTKRGSRSGFTLVELIVTMLVLSLISGAVFSAFLFFNKSGINIGHYTDMDRQARSALERFGVDVRMAAAINWTSSTQIQLVVPLNETGGTYTVTYRYFDNSFGTPALRRTFSRQVTASSDTTIMPIDATFQRLLTDVVSFTFRRYRVGSPTAATASSPTIPQAINNLETKQINIDLTTERKTAVVARATNVVLSGRYVLRNKVVAN